MNHLLNFLTVSWIILYRYSSDYLWTNSILCWIECFVCAVSRSYLGVNVFAPPFSSSDKFYIHSKFAQYFSDPLRNIFQILILPSLWQNLNLFQIPYNFFKNLLNWKPSFERRNSLKNPQIINISSNYLSMINPLST